MSRVLQAQVEGAKVRQGANPPFSPNDFFLNDEELNGSVGEKGGDKI